MFLCSFHTVCTVVLGWDVGVGGGVIGWVVLSLWKLRVGVEAYYLSQVASGLNDYYTGAGEAVGQWIGSGIAGLGVAGEVDGEELRAVLAGLTPGTGLTPNGTRLVVHPRHVPGFDLTFSVPKSVSIVYALGDPRLQAGVLDASQAAVRDTVAWLERHACFVRRGSNSTPDVDGRVGVSRMMAEGFVAAEFRHRTSRAGDPQLHWHVLVANLAQGVDGRWSALDGTAIYQARRTASALFHTSLRDHLSRRLGVEWGPVRNDIAEIAGVPELVRREFSQRRVEIEEWLDTHSRSGPVAAAEATLATRRTKPGPVDAVALDREWKQRAERVGWGPVELERLAASWVTRQPEPGDRWIVTDHVNGSARERVTGFDEWIARVVDDRLIAVDSTFTRHQLTQAIAGALPTATIAHIETLTHRALACERIIPVPLLPDPVLPDPGHTRPGQRDLGQRDLVRWGGTGRVTIPTGVIRDTTRDRYTSRGLLEIEARYLDSLDTGHHRDVGILDPGHVTAVIEDRGGLGVDQAGAVRAITGDGHGIHVLVGRAGTGKTWTLGAVRDAYETAGWTVTGAAPSARAARELEVGAGITSRTIASHLHHREPWTATTLVVIDEAGMANTRDIAALVETATRTGAKVLLVGDHHQLPEIGAGGAFRAAVERHPATVSELTINRRQHLDWERDALDQLRHGNPHLGLAAYHDHDRVHTASTPTELHPTVITHWANLRDTGHDVLLLAGTRTETRQLNTLARTHLHTTGALTGTEQRIGNRDYTTGDRVVLLRNATHHQPDPPDRAHPPDRPARPDPPNRPDVPHRRDVPDRPEVSGRLEVSGRPGMVRVENGTVATITAITPNIAVDVTTSDGRRVRLDWDYATHHLDHGYALTIHKAQGVTTDHALIVGPSGLYREAIYVALSRARHGAWIYATPEQLAELAERHGGIPLPGERTRPDPDADLHTRVERTGVKHLAHHHNPQILNAAQLADHHTAGELHRLARHATDIEHRSPHDPTTAQLAAVRATDVRARLELGVTAHHTPDAPARTTVTGTITRIDDHAGTATITTNGRRPRHHEISWHHLHLPGDPAPVEITPTAAATLARYHTTADQTSEQHRRYLADHHLEPGDPARYRAAARVASHRVVHTWQHQPTNWLHHELGPRPTRPTAAAAWDDTIAQIATWHAHHDLPNTTIGLGPRPDHPTDARRWDQLHHQLHDNTRWLHTHQPRTPNPTELTTRDAVERRDQLRAFIATAPTDQHDTIRHLLNHPGTGDELAGQLRIAIELHEHRNTWIITNWPHIVELHQLEHLINQRPALDHWPTPPTPPTPPASEIPDDIHRVLTALAAHATPPATIEPRSLHELDTAARDRDPIHLLDERHRQLRQDIAALHRTLTDDTLPATRRHTLTEQTTALTNTANRIAGELRTLRHQPGRQPPTADPHHITNRLATLTYTTLTNPPSWATDHLHKLHRTGQLTSTPPTDLARHLIEHATHLDRHPTIDHTLTITPPTKTTPTRELTPTR